MTLLQGDAPATTRRVVLVGGHESAAGQALRERADVSVVGVGRELYALTRQAAVVVPMTLGRDTALAAQIAQVLRWTGRGRPGELLLTPPLGTTTHLVSWLRAAVDRTASRTAQADGEPDRGRAVLVTAPSASAAEDAELFRVARLVRQHSGVRWVEVALLGGDPDVAEGVSRCRLLGARQVSVVPASFVEASLPQGVTRAGPLLSEASLGEVIRRRIATAEHRWAQHGADGLTLAHPHDHDHSH